MSSWSGATPLYWARITSLPRLADHHLSVKMCTLATEQTSPWLMADPWEAFQDYQRTAVVLDHFEYELNTILGGAQLPLSGERRPIRVMLLAGSDLIGTMSEPGVWTEKDVSSSWCSPAGRPPHLHR
jgi:nicotinamide mononucleotide adenylyltransferase